ncbi:hydroxyethylthiazole kinase [Ulvibacter litoralis]|uniref:Hydroxyethylthiazole kinase n=1 Tax=Ulvibacter litoralis TaxID=227084 RepID=A0A1G7J1F6_9FLAO|nr:hydroxyethylthiazole kinase [Ulvibacter litoralis]GHC60491.1 hydroxyethylthiazole kinase [Ulvibacter litoralis]SDF18721.1 hydroxyethylthiazole kinase [Ulvibacter litoralis]
MVASLWKNILLVRKKSPLVHNITNFVVMNNTANALLAVGASPIMAHAHAEIDEMTSLCASLVINIGTLDEYWVEAMCKAAKKANQASKPFILDPVGAGATHFRDSTLSKLVDLKPTVIRANASEILALAKFNKTKTKGVDSTAHSSEAIEAAKVLNETFGAVICISGETDIVVSGERQIQVKNGSPLMTKVTGLGCSATAIIGAFIAVIEDKTEAVLAATALMAIAGEIAAKEAKGPGSLQVLLLDKLYNITEAEFTQHCNIERVS